MNRQLLLDFGPSVTPTLGNFVPGENAQVLHLLQAIAAGTPEERQLHLWGEPGCGKSHLLMALGDRANARYVDCARSGEAALAWAPQTLVWCIDNVGLAQAKMQVELFNLINILRAQPQAALVTAADAPPLHLALREDLRSRLGWGPVFQVIALGDDERCAALAQRASERGLVLSDEVCRYLLTHFRRDMRSLVGLVDALDRYALEKHRALTLPLVREWLQGSTAPHDVS